MESLRGQISSSDRESQTRYDCLEWLGAGGMSEVFLGVQRGTEDFNRVVVIKKMLVRPTGTENVDTLKMLTREARYIANLSHPHIVKVFDLAAHDRNLVITMEYVEGETLRSIISSLIKAKKHFPIPILCRLISDAAEALHYVHNATGPDGSPLGLVHHDIDTTNLMVETSGHIKLIDFGLASSSRHPDKTMSNIFAGKLTFAAPEVFLYPGQSDVRSDVYSLGIVLYIMATLNKPFQFTDEPIEARMRRVISEPIPVPSSINREIPQELDAIMASATHKDRDKRFQSAEHFADAIEWLASQHGGMATVQEVRRWLFDICGETIEQRRDWMRELIGNARSAAIEIKPGQTDSAGAGSASRMSNPPSATSETVPAGRGVVLDSHRPQSLAAAKVAADVKTFIRRIGGRIFANKNRRIAYLSAVAAGIVFIALAWHSVYGYSQPPGVIAGRIQQRPPKKADVLQADKLSKSAAETTTLSEVKPVVLSPKASTGVAVKPRASAQRGLGCK
jgi:serine/threonine protein kinase